VRPILGDDDMAAIAPSKQLGSCAPGRISHCTMKILLISSSMAMT